MLVLRFLSLTRGNSVTVRTIPEVVEFLEQLGWRAAASQVQGNAVVESVPEVLRRIADMYQNASSLDPSVSERADAWLKMCGILREHSNDLFAQSATGHECVEKEIRRLQQSDAILTELRERLARQ